jgi:hypothetical protein
MVASKEYRSLTRALAAAPIRCIISGFAARVQIDRAIPSTPPTGCTKPVTPCSTASELPKGQSVTTAGKRSAYASSSALLMPSESLVKSKDVAGGKEGVRIIPKAMPRDRICYPKLNGQAPKRRRFLPVAQDV